MVANLDRSEQSGCCEPEQTNWRGTRREAAEPPKGISDRLQRDSLHPPHRRLLRTLRLGRCQAKARRESGLSLRHARDSGCNRRHRFGLMILRCRKSYGGDYADDERAGADTDQQWSIGSPRCETDLQNFDAFYDEIKAQQVRKNLQHASHETFPFGASGHCIAANSATDEQE